MLYSQIFRNPYLFANLQRDISSSRPLFYKPPLSFSSPWLMPKCVQLILFIKQNLSVICSKLFSKLLMFEVSNSLPPASAPRALPELSLMVSSIKPALTAYCETGLVPETSLLWCIKHQASISLCRLMDNCFVVFLCYSSFSMRANTLRLFTWTEFNRFLTFVFQYDLLFGDLITKLSALKKRCGYRRLLPGNLSAKPISGEFLSEFLFFCFFGHLEEDWTWLLKSTERERDGCLPVPMPECHTDSRDHTLWPVGHAGGGTRHNTASTLLFTSSSSSGRICTDCLRRSTSRSNTYITFTLPPNVAPNVGAGSRAHLGERWPTLSANVAFLPVTH